MITLLVDGDILAYRYSATSEQRIEWEPGLVTREAGDLDDAYVALRGEVDRLRAAVMADRAVICVTPSTNTNWRNAILPTYKSNRDPAKRPLLVDAMRERIIADGGYARPGLEADDIIGILATHPSIIRGRKIIWSVDKDLLQIPGYHVGKDGIVEEISESEAFRWHMMQTLTGDVTDGYSGCPGVGKKRAAAYLENAFTPAEMWAAVVEAYTDRGFTEEDALVQARVARILRHTDYNFEKQEPILWTPVL